jgi:hypothetical protein
VTLAVRAHVAGALDFGGIGRYRAGDNFRKRLVYEALEREDELAAAKAAYEKLSWFIPVAEDRRGVAKSAHEMYLKYVELLQGGRIETGGPDYRRIWEEYWGMKIGSPEYLEWEKRLKLDEAMRRREQGGA